MLSIFGRVELAYGTAMGCPAAVLG